MVTYSLAWLSHATAKRTDLNVVWNAQALSAPLETAIATIVSEAHAHITNPPGGQNVTEWCKKESCWQQFRDRAIDLPVDLEGELRPASASGGDVPQGAADELGPDQVKLIESIAAVPSDTWFDFSHGLRKLKRCNRGSAIWPTALGA